jgi:acetoin utilization deacetylase AcuC-like enzyme
MATYYRHPLSFEHETGAHPENARRITAIEAELADRDWLGLRVEEAPPATREQLERVHTAAHIEMVERLSASGGGMIDFDTIASPRSFEAALRSAGGAVTAAESLLSGEERFAFCGLRPPGHHAERGRAMGFCLFNNAAIAAAHALAQDGVDRVAIVDWDVHHGNGTQEVFYDSAEVLFFSIHQMPLYPGTGEAGETGSGPGDGYTINLPVPPGAGPDEFLALVQMVVAPVTRAFAPDLLIVSAGYDAHREDPLGQCLLDDRAYAEMAASLRDLASDLGIGAMACLEGGYAADALARSVAATIASFTDAGKEARTAPRNELAEGHRRRLEERWALV